MSSVKGTIKTGKHTENHGTWLKNHGYTVEQGDGKIVVTGTEFVEAIDLSGPDGGVAVLKEVIAAKKLLTYGTKAQTAKGPRSSIMLCGFLGTASALVVKPVGQGKAQATNLFASL